MLAVERERVVVVAVDLGACVDRSRLAGGQVEAEHPAVVVVDEAPAIGSPVRRLERILRAVDRPADARVHVEKLDVAADVVAVGLEVRAAPGEQGGRS